MTASLGDLKQYRFAVGFHHRINQRLVILVLATSRPHASKAVGEIQVLLTRSLFGDGILRRLLQRVSLAKPTSAALRC